MVVLPPLEKQEKPYLIIFLIQINIQWNSHQWAYFFRMLALLLLWVGLALGGTPNCGKTQLSSLPEGDPQVFCLFMLLMGSVLNVCSIIAQTSSQVPQLPWLSVASGLGNLTNKHHANAVAEWPRCDLLREVLVKWNFINQDAGTGNYPSMCSLFTHLAGVVSFYFCLRKTLILYI